MKESAWDQIDRNLVAEKHKINKHEHLFRKIEDHEILCRIMQIQTHDNIHKIESQISRLEKIVLVSAGMLIMGMANMIFMLLTNSPA